MLTNPRDAFRSQSRSPNIYIHCVHEKSNPQTMCDRDVKPEYILIKLGALVLRYIRERTTKFREKILFDSRVINIQMTKYLGFQYSAAYCSQLTLVNS